MTIISPKTPTGFDASIIREYIKGLHDIQAPAPAYRSDLDVLTHKYIKTWGLAPTVLKPLVRYIPASVNFVANGYGNTPTEPIVFLIVYTALFFYVDDNAQRLLPQMKQVVGGCWGATENRDVCEDPLLARLVRHMLFQTPKYYSQYNTGAIIKGTIDYFLGTIIEAEYPDGMKIPASAGRCPRFLRSKTGVAETYTHFLFPEALVTEREGFMHYFPAVPDLMNFIDICNDVLSFYKEWDEGEKNIYVMNQARLTGCSPMEILKGFCEDHLSLVKDIRQTCSKSPAVTKILDTFFHGYFVFHIATPRYRLSELGVVQGRAIQ